MATLFCALVLDPNILQELIFTIFYKIFVCLENLSRFWTTAVLG
jgi:hypothetical protein